MNFPPIEQLVPHEPPMRLIERVLDFDPRLESIVCRAVPSAACPFVRSGSIPAILSLEYMAQTVAAYVTLRRVVQAPGQTIAPRVGFIVSARDLRLGVDHLELEVPLIIKAKLVWSDTRTASFDCSLEVSDTEQASTRLSVYEPPTARGEP